MATFALNLIQPLVLQTPVEYWELGLLLSLTSTFVAFCEYGVCVYLDVPCLIVGRRFCDEVDDKSHTSKVVWREPRTKMYIVVLLPKTVLISHPCNLVYKTGTLKTIEIANKTQKATYFRFPFQIVCLKWFSILTK